MEVEANLIEDGMDEMILRVEIEVEDIIFEDDRVGEGEQVKFSHKLGFSSHFASSKNPTSIQTRRQ